jgi:hypothetical protein
VEERTRGWRGEKWERREERERIMCVQQPQNPGDNKKKNRGAL